MRYDMGESTFRMDQRPSLRVPCQNRTRTRTRPWTRIVRIIGSKKLNSRGGAFRNDVPRGFPLPYLFEKILSSFVYEDFMRDRHQSQRDFDRRRLRSVLGPRRTPAQSPRRIGTITSRSTKPELIRALLHSSPSKLLVHVRHAYRNRSNGRTVSTRRSASPTASVGSSTSIPNTHETDALTNALTGLRRAELYRVYRAVTEHTPESSPTRPVRSKRTPPVLGPELLRYLNAYPTGSNGIGW